MGLLLLAVKLDLGERAFVLWSGLKGAVPILLGMFIITSGTVQAPRVYAIIFIVVLVSVIVQGGLVPTVAAAFRVPTRLVEQQPWALGMRFRDEPRGLRHHVVAPGSSANGATIAELSLGESGWISMVKRDGQLVQVRGHTTLQAGDTVLTLADPDVDLSHLFESTR